MKNLCCEQNALMADIEKGQLRLNRMLSRKKGSLSDWEVIKLSQYIDRLIVQYVREDNNGNKN